MVTFAAIGLGVALVAFATWGEVNRKTRLSGLLVPTQGSLNIAAPNSGVLADFSDRGRLFQSDRGRCFSAIVDEQEVRASERVNVSQSSTISVKRGVAKRLLAAFGADLSTAADGACDVPADAVDKSSAALARWRS